MLKLIWILSSKGSYGNTSLAFSLINYPCVSLSMFYKVMSSLFSLIDESKMELTIITSSSFTTYELLSKIGSLSWSNFSYLPFLWPSFSSSLVFIILYFSFSKSFPWRDSFSPWKGSIDIVSFMRNYSVKYGVVMYPSLFLSIASSSQASIQALKRASWDSRLTSYDNILSINSHVHHYPHLVRPYHFHNLL